MTHLLRIAILTGIILLYISSASAQTQSLHAGTKTPYPTPHPQYTPPPDGFTPVFVNYVGRHGARFFTKAGSDVAVQQALLIAKKDRALTPLGKQLLAMTQRFISIQKNNYENITALGKEEQVNIGKRLLHNYPTAFTGKGLAVFTTYKVRTQQSADAFLEGFAGYAGKKQYRIVPDSLDTTLRFYDLSPAYQQFKKSMQLEGPADSLLHDAKTSQAATQICARIFKPSYKTKSISFTNNLYDLYCGQWSLPVEMQQHHYSKSSIDFSNVFDTAQLAWFDFINGAEDFLEKGAGRDTLGIQATVAAPLLADFITTTSEVINHTKQVDAILRFTHAEAISPFATLLGIPQASVPAASIYQYNQHWSAESIIPLSANIQWIVYSNGSEYLLKVLLNEKETGLPIPTLQYPYYKWEDVKKYYLKKLKSI